MTSDSTRDRIILSAGPIFARKGFRATTVREICDAANVNLASINYYFGDKQKLYTETLMRAREMRAEKFPEPSFEFDAPPELRLQKVVGVLLNRLMAMQSEPWQVRLIMREVLQPTEASRPLIEQSFRPFVEMLLNIIDELVGFQLDDPQRKQVGFSILGQCLFYRTSAATIALMISEREFQRDFTVEQLTEHITSFSLGAIASIRQQHLSRR